MKTPEDIKKGLEYCARSFQDRSACRECAYKALCFAAMPRSVLLKDLCAYVTQLKAREWDLFDLLSSAWFGKQCYFQQEDGTVYSRSSGEYMSFDQAIDEFAHELTFERESPGEDIIVPSWISVEERLPEMGDIVLVIANGKPREHITLIDAVLIASYWGKEGWIADGFDGWDKLEVTHWMPLPEGPKEG